ncbi:MAG: GMC family oxidoreductase N-terminal domain-containing protein [Longimicrobiaceae bacterium]
MSDSADFSAPERRIFAAVASAVVGAPAGEEVALAALPFLHHLPAGDRALLSLLLRTLEYGAPLLTGRPRRFTSLGAEAQQEVLESWAASRLGLQRQGAAALRALAMLAYYGREEGGVRVGYDGAWLGRVEVPVLPAPELRAARRLEAGSGASARTSRPRLASALPAGVTRGRDLDRDLRIRAQVCVIGTGAGGAAALARLAEQGIEAVAVEAGPHTTAAEFTQRELEMLPLLYQEAALRATADKAIGIMQGRGVGGSTLHNTGLVYPTPVGILERWRREHAFPWDDASWQGYVDQVLRTLRATPIPPEQINPNNDALRRGCEALGWRYRVPLHNREECCGCGYCMLGCAYNRKLGASLTWLPRAVTAGARILADAPVTRIEGHAGMRRVVCELRGADGTPTGRRAVVHAPVVLLAAGALDTPALLLRSGLGNSRVGRGLRLHPAAMVSGVFSEPVIAWRGLPQSVIVEEFASFEKDGRGGFLFLPSAANLPGLTALVVPGLGAEHLARMQDYPRLASASVLLHDESEGRVRAAGDGRPLADYWPGREDLAELRRGIRELARLYLAAGAERVILPHPAAPSVSSAAELEAALRRLTPTPHRLTLNSVHPQGSCALGADAERSATDPHGELWGERGIFVGDASLFPTSVGVPPQVTIMALASAVAEYVVAERV